MPAHMLIKVVSRDFQRKCVILFVAALTLADSLCLHPLESTSSRPLPLQGNSWNPALEEQKRLIKAHQGEINYDALQDMEVLHRNITEALRMHPPLILVLRCTRAGA